MERNPPWSTDERILALDLYFRRGQLGAGDPEVVELSEEINALPIDVDVDKSDTFRNPNAVAMKLGNFAHFDDEYDGVGLTSFGRRDQELWEAYTNRREDLHALAQAIKRGLSDGSLSDVLKADEDSAMEGRLLWKSHRTRERNPGLSRKRKKVMRQSVGQLICEVCDFSEEDSRAIFGETTSDIFECHHDVPLHQLDGSRETRVSDLKVLCPNCHRTIHRVEPTITTEEFRKRVQGLRYEHPAPRVHPTKGSI